MSMSQITSTLFLSGADAPLNQALVSRKGITLIVNATLNHACPVYPGVECIRVPVSDLPSARLGVHFDRVAERIHGNRAGGTLVHCAAGMSRSPALVMAYLMRYRGVTLRQAHSWVQESRPYVRLNSGFWAQLLEYERRLYGKNTVKVAQLEEPLLPPPTLSLTPRLTRSVLLQQQVPRTTLFPDKSPLLPRSLLSSKSLPTPPLTPRLTRSVLLQQQVPRTTLFPDKSPLLPRSLLSSRSFNKAKRSKIDGARHVNLIF